MSSVRNLFVLVLVCVLISACASVGTRTTKDGDSRSPAEVNAQLGIEYMREGMYEAALEKLKKALRQDPRLPAAHASIAILYERLGEVELADKHYSKAYDLMPDNPRILNNYGQYLCRRGKLEEADELFRKALRDPLYRNPAVVLTNAGLCAEKRPDLELAESYFREALARQPEFAPALRQMVRVSFAREHHLAARAYLQRLQAVAPLGPELLWVGVRAESALGDRDAAGRYALLLKDRFPESEQAQALIAWERRQRER